MRIVYPGLCALLSALLGGCGYVGEPMYPASNIPSRITDLAAVERGSHIAVAFTLPTLTTEGLPVKTLGSIDLRVGPAPSGDFHAESWAEAAEKVKVAVPVALGTVHASAPLDGFIGKTVILGIRVANTKGRFSDWSNFVPVSVTTPVETPTDVTAIPVPQGVQLRWQAHNGQRFRIFRLAGTQQTPAEVGHTDLPEYLDMDIQYGEKYTYFVQALNGRAESEVTSGVTVTPVDKFPPAAPAGITASAGVTSVELAWERNTEPDFSTYRIYRSVNGGPFEKLDEVQIPSYSDTKVEPGRRYRYRVTAIDQNGNESAPSEPVDVHTP